MPKFSIRGQLKKPPAWVIGATLRTGLHCPETAEGGGATQKQHIGTRRPKALPMLMNVAKQDSAQGQMRTQNSLK